MESPDALQNRAVQCFRCESVASINQCLQPKDQSTGWAKKLFSVPQLGARHDGREGSNPLIEFFTGIEEPIQFIGRPFAPCSWVIQPQTSIAMGFSI
jgi:hypothetical protein